MKARQINKERNGFTLMLGTLWSQSILISMCFFGTWGCSLPQPSSCTPNAEGHLACGDGFFCNQDSVCQARDCRNGSPPEPCGQGESCAPDSDGGYFCLASDDLGGTPMTQMAGESGAAGGADAGAEVAGAEVAGAEVAGAEFRGGDDTMGGSASVPLAGQPSRGGMATTEESGGAIHTAGATAPDVGGHDDEAALPSGGREDSGTSDGEGNEMPTDELDEQSPDVEGPPIEQGELTWSCTSTDFLEGVDPKPSILAVTSDADAFFMLMGDPPAPTIDGGGLAPELPPEYAIWWRPDGGAVGAVGRISLNEAASGETYREPAVIARGGGFLYGVEAFEAGDSATLYSFNFNPSIVSEANQELPITEVRPLCEIPETFLANSPTDAAFAAPHLFLSFSAGGFNPDGAADESLPQSALVAVVVPDDPTDADCAVYSLGLPEPPPNEDETPHYEISGVKVYPAEQRVTEGWVYETATHRLVPFEFSFAEGGSETQVNLEWRYGEMSDLLGIEQPFPASITRTDAELMLFSPQNGAVELCVADSEQEDPPPHNDMGETPCTPLMRAPASWHFDPVTISPFATGEPSRKIIFSNSSASSSNAEELESAIYEANYSFSEPNHSDIWTLELEFLLRDSNPASGCSADNSVAQNNLNESQTLSISLESTSSAYEIELKPGRPPIVLKHVDDAEEVNLFESLETNMDCILERETPYLKVLTFDHGVVSRTRSVRLALFGPQSNAGNRDGFEWDNTPICVLTGEFDEDNLAITTMSLTVNQGTCGPIDVIDPKVCNQPTDRSQ